MAGTPVLLRGSPPRVIRRGAPKTRRAKGGSGTGAAATARLGCVRGTRFRPVACCVQDPGHACGGAAAVLASPNSVPGNGIKSPLEYDTSAHACTARRGMVSRGNVKGGVRRLV